MGHIWDMQLLSVSITMFPLCLVDGVSSSKMFKTQQAARRFHSECVTNKSWWKKLAKQSFPIIDTLRTYKRSYIIGDFAAGISVGIASVPMGKRNHRNTTLLSSELHYGTCGWHVRWHSLSSYAQS